MKVTSTNFSNIYRAFEAISHDRGTQAGHKSYWIPDDWAFLRLTQIDFALGHLPNDEFEIFCIGEQGEAEHLAGEYSFLMDAHLLLNQFFEEDWPMDIEMEFCDFCWNDFEPKKLKRIKQRPELQACPSCHPHYAGSFREAWKLGMVLASQELSNQQIRALVPECLNVPTEYVPPKRAEHIVRGKGGFRYLEKSLGDVYEDPSDDRRRARQHYQ